MAKAKSTSNAASSVSFAFERQTKNTYRFMEVDEKGEAVEQAQVKIGTIYAKKSMFPGGAPAKLTVTLTPSAEVAETADE